ncbi:MAG: DNA internalization-related competence protein ComEC/Rec2 [Syntrophobacteraceae bacterium]
MLGIGSQRLLEGVGRIQPEYFALACLALLAASLIFLRFPDRVPGFQVQVLLFLVFGMWAAQAAAPELPHPKRLDPFLGRQLVPYIAEVSAPPEHYPDKVKIPLRINAALVDGKQVPLNVGALLTVSRKDGPAEPLFRLPGDRLIVRMTLRPFRNFKNPGGFDYARYQAEQGFYASAFIKDEASPVVLAPGSGHSPGPFLKRAWGRIDLFRQKALFWLKRSLDPDSAAFYAALILGYQHFLDRTWQDRIQRTGLNHLLSVSGLHLGLVSLLVFHLVRLLVRTACPKLLNGSSDSRIAVWPALACAVIYAFLAGFGVPPIWRSVLMLAVCFGAAFWRRSPDSLTVLALAALVILVFDPNSLWQISFQLTFACVLAIVLIYPKLRGRSLAGKIPGGLARKIASLCEDAFRVSIAVSILVLPLTIFYFNGFSLAGFAANVFLVPYVGFIILPWGLFSLAVYAVSETLAFPLIRAGEWLLAVCLHFIKWFDNFSWSYFWTGGMSLPWLFAIYAGLALIFAPLSRKARLAGFGALILLFFGHAALGTVLRDGNGGGLLRADVIDVGQGSAALVRFPTGEAMLVDGGGFRDDSYDIGRAVVAPFLWRLGVRRLDHVVVSHDHPDHRNGLRFILSHFDTGCFWTSGITDRGAGGEEGGKRVLEEIASRRNIRVRSFPELGDEIRIGEARVRVIHPGPYYRDRRELYNLNDLSLVIEVVFGETALILPGDIGRDIEIAIAPGFRQGRRVLLVSPHHGSEYSNSGEFLDALRPRAVVFSCGYGNQFGFPAPGALRRCGERNIGTFRTDLDGMVHAVSDGRQWTISAEERR